MSGQSLSNVIKLYRGSGVSPQSYTDNVGNVIDFNGPETTNERVEVTDGDSPASSKEYLPARQDPGPLRLTMNMVANVHDDLFTDASAVPPAVRSYRLQPTSVTTTYFTGSAFVGTLSPSGNSRGGAFQLACSLQPTAAWILTHA
jgi:hypothetical protein